MENQIKEIWKDIKEYEGYYQVSNLGRIKSLARKINTNTSNKNRKTRNRILKPSGNRYKIIRLRIDGIWKDEYIHRLVAQHFIPNPENKPQVNHKNEIISDNSVNNLEWCTAKYNSNFKGNNYRRKEGSKLKVFQYDMNKKLIATYPSIIEASKDNEGFSRGHISSVCNGKRKQHKGFIWSFTEL